MKQLLLFMFSCFFLVGIYAQEEWNPSHPSWTDSFEANGLCWCNSTNYDHGIGEKTMEINGELLTIIEICEELTKHPDFREYVDGDPPYNDIQCGNGPPNDDGLLDEIGCPGRTDLGSEGCLIIGPGWDMDWLETRFGQNCNTTTDAFSIIEAENYCSSSGIQTEPSSEGTDNIGYINNGDWLKFDGINLTGVTSVSARVACDFDGGNIELRTGSTTGTLIGSVSVSNTGGNQDYETVTANIFNVSGIQELYVVFTGGDGFLFNLNWFQFSGSNTSTGFTPDPSKTYYIDSAFHNLRIASSGESEDPYLTSTTTSNDDTKWKFVDKGNGYWHIDRAAGGSKPRLRSDSTTYADMQATTSAGTYTYYEFTEGFINNSYFLTLPNGPANFERLQITPNNEIKMVPTSHIGTWESFYITEADSNTSFSVIEAEDYNAMSGIQTELSTESGDNVGWINNTDWLRFDGVNLTGAQSINVRVACNFTGGTIEVRTGSTTGNLIGSINVSNTGANQNWQTLSTNLSNVSGTQNVYLVFTGGNGYLFNVNWLQFSASSTSSKNINTVSNSSLPEVKIYPSLLTAVTKIEGAENSTLNIYDISGRLLISKDINGQNEALNLSKLSTGIYYAEIVKGAEKKIIKLVKK